MEHSAAAGPLADYQVGDRVLTKEGYPGTVDDVLEGPADLTTVWVTLDNQMGGGEYAEAELQPLQQSRAQLASVEHTAADDYPELGSILTDRLPPEITTLRHAAKQATSDEARDWNDAGAHEDMEGDSYVEPPYAEDLASHLEAVLRTEAAHPVKVERTSTGVVVTTPDKVVPFNGKAAQNAVAVVVGQWDEAHGGGWNITVHGSMDAALKAKNSRRSQTQVAVLPIGASKTAADDYQGQSIKGTCEVCGKKIVLKRGSLTHADGSNDHAVVLSDGGPIGVSSALADHLALYLPPKPPDQQAASTTPLTGEQQQGYREGFAHGREGITRNPSRPDDLDYRAGYEIGWAEGVTVQREPANTWAEDDLAADQTAGIGLPAAPLDFQVSGSVTGAKEYVQVGNEDYAREVTETQGQVSVDGQPFGTLRRDPQRTTRREWVLTHPDGQESEHPTKGSALSHAGKTHQPKTSSLPSVEAGALWDFIKGDPKPGKYWGGVGREYSFDWCRFRRMSHCWLPKGLNEEASRQAGYAVWIPEDRGHCPRIKWEDQAKCPVGEPGPNSGPGGLLDATVPWEEGGQHGGEPTGQPISGYPEQYRPNPPGVSSSLSHQGTAVSDSADNPDLSVEADRRMGGLQTHAVFEVTASWSDIRRKAKRIREQGGVRVIANNDNTVVAHVKGDHGIYETEVVSSPGRHNAAYWACGCKWSAYSWGRSGPWKRFEGRMCSHALALHLEAQSRGMQGRTMTLDEKQPAWMNQRHVYRPGDYDRDTQRYSALEATRHPVHEFADDEPTPAHLIARAMLEDGQPYREVRAALLDLGVDRPADIVNAARKHAFKAKVDGIPVDLTITPDGQVVDSDGDPVTPALVEHPNWHPSYGLNPNDTMIGAQVLIEASKTARRQTRMMPVSQLLQYALPRDDEMVDDAKVRAYAEQMRESGYDEDWADENDDHVRLLGDRVLNGNHRIHAADEAGLSHLPVEVLTEGHTGAKKDDGPTVSGVALKAADTGRILMLQRGLGDEKDPAAGTWEFPGGHHEEGDTTSLHAGIREWEEEVGQKFPEGGTVVHTWSSPNGVYQGHVVVIPEESAVCLHQGRDIDNPDDPDGDESEQVAWWDPEHAKKNPALRQECKDSPWSVLKTAMQVKEGSKVDLFDEALGSAPLQRQASQRQATPVTEWGLDEPFGADPSYEFDQYPPFAAAHPSLDEEPEAALPVTYGEDDDEPDKIAARLQAALTPGAERSPAAQPGRSAEERGRRLLAYVDASLRGEAPAGPNPFSHLQAGLADNELASAAANYLVTRGGLSTEALKTYSPIERQALIDEGKEEGVGASNLDRLDIKGTHYEALQQATSARSEDEDLWLLNGDPNGMD